jgi:hypothetical protein
MGEIGSARDRRDPGMRRAWWAQDRSDPHARVRALSIAGRDPPPGVSPDEAVAAVRDVLDAIGDTCPECPREE